MTASVRALPVAGGVYEDDREDGHALRVSYHPDTDICVLSIWRAGCCAATFRIARQDVPQVITGLADCLAYQTPQGGPPWSEPTELIVVAPVTSALRNLRDRLRRRPRT